MWTGNDTEYTGEEVLPCLTDVQNDSGEYENSEEDIKKLGEVFTPTPLVNEMLDKLPTELFIDKTKTFLDNSCGNGQFLFQVLKRKMENGISYTDAIKTIYGVDISQKNVDDCKARLLMGYTYPEWVVIVNHNIVCADALNPNHKGWDSVGYMWDTAYEQFFDV